MKRSSSVKLALMSASAVVITACGQAKEEAAVYESIAQCEEAGVVDAANCTAQFEAAQAVHQETAPRYAREEDCFTDFGYQGCQRFRTSGGSSVFLPFMLGYLLAPRGGSGVFTQPLYRSADDPNTFRTASNKRIGSVGPNGVTQVAKSTARQPSARTRTVSRGGFGARAARGAAG